MGIVLGRVVFDGDPPALAAIVQSLERLTGLGVRAEADDDTLGVHAWKARLAFTCDPTQDVTVYAYRPGAVKASCHEMFPDAPWLTARVQGAHETAERRTVYVRGYIGQEMTLLVAVELALEALGGRMESPLSAADREAFGVRITPDALARRREESRRDGYRMMALAVPLTLLMLPFSWLWSVLTLPWRLWRAYRFVQGRRPPVNPA